MGSEMCIRDRCIDCLLGLAVIAYQNAAKGGFCDKGSPNECRAEAVVLKGSYSAGKLLKITNGLKISKSTDSNSCPKGWKLWSPQNQQDWQTVKDSTTIPAAPHLIVDVTRASNGCGGCTKYPMNSGVTQQSTWKTSDGSPWWLRDTKYNEPNGDYIANCYLSIISVKADDITFNDGNCAYSSTHYLCQPRGIGLAYCVYCCRHVLNLLRVV